MEKIFKELNLYDDFLFINVMNNKEICQKVLKKILNFRIKELIFPNSKNTTELLLNDNGICAVIYKDDDKGTVCNCKILLGKYGDSLKRSRYHQEHIDRDWISRSQPCGKLQKSFIIYICTFDPFRKGRYMYTFQNTCRENPNLLLGDESTILFLNTKGTSHDDVDDGMKEFLAYFEDTTDSFVSHAGSQLVREIHKKVTEIKQNKEAEEEYMKLLQRDITNINLGRKRGQSEGEEKMAALVRLLLKEGRNKDLEQILEDFVYRKELYKEFHLD